MAGFLATLLTTSFIAFLVLLLFMKIDPANTLLYTAAGVLFGMAKDSVQYFLGSSQSSADQSILLAKAPPVPDSAASPVPPVEPQ
jgi:hypothetical protein